MLTDHINSHFKLHPVLNRLLITSSLLHPFSTPLLSLSRSISSCMASGAMWPGLKTESRLPEAPSVGQTGFLSFSSGYTSTQPSQIHYTYPSQGKPATALSLSLPPIDSSTRSLQPTASSVWGQKTHPDPSKTTPINTQSDLFRRCMNLSNANLELCLHLFRFLFHYIKCVH